MPLEVVVDVRQGLRRRVEELHKLPISVSVRPDLPVEIERRREEVRHNAVREHVAPQVTKALQIWKHGGEGKRNKKAGVTSVGRTRATSGRATARLDATPNGRRKTYGEA